MNRTLKNIILFPMNILYKFCPELELKIMFYLQNGYGLNLNNPKTYNEKLNWMKLYYRPELLQICTDKYMVRQYVRDCGCAELLNELLWEGFDADKIPFDELPEQFVIKVTHGSGNNIICRNKSELDINKTTKTLKKWLKQKFMPCYGEWFYGNVKPRIIIERILLNDQNEVPEDYKVLCFDGKAKYIIVDTDRFNGHKRNVYNLNWNWMEGYNLDFPNDKPMKRPDCLNELILEAEKLAKNFPHVRVDFYVINRKIYFGELTFTNGAGFDRIQPYSFDVELGSYLNLPSKIISE